jgi:hypothetical protein
MGQGSPLKHPHLKDRAPLFLCSILGIGNTVLRSVKVLAAALCDVDCDALSEWLGESTTTKIWSHESSSLAKYRCSFHYYVSMFPHNRSSAIVSD